MLSRRAFVRRLPLVGVLGAAELLDKLAVAQEAGPKRSVKIAEEFGGQQSELFPMEYPGKLGFRHGEKIDKLYLNGEEHGLSGGGQPTQIIELDGDDYWNEFTIHSGAGVDYMEFKSKHGYTITGGGEGGTLKRLTVGDIRILRIGGRAGLYVDHITIEFIENYQPSTLVSNSEMAVIDFMPGKTEITNYEEEDSQYAWAYERIVEHTDVFKLDASASGELAAKFSVSTGLTRTDSTKESIKRSAQESLKRAGTTKITIEDDQIFLRMAPVTIMLDVRGNAWMYATNPPGWAKVSLEVAKQRLVGLYDLTGGIAAFQTGLGTVWDHGYRRLIAK